MILNCQNNSLVYRCGVAEGDACSADDVAVVCLLDLSLEKLIGSGGVSLLSSN